MGRPTENPKGNYTGIRLTDDEVRKLDFCMKRIPFEIVADSFYSRANIERLEKAVADADTGKNMTEHELIGEEQ